MAVKSEADLIDEAYADDLKARWSTLFANVAGTKPEERDECFAAFARGCELAREVRNRAQQIVQGAST